ncbi:MAG: 50S ribosomal protein L11 [Candidatus Micrarchaeaceae archaeon]
METLVQALIEGGKASGGPPLGPMLGPLGVNIPAIVGEINEKTKEFAGIKILAKVYIDAATKKYHIEIGVPSTSALILKTLGAPAGAKTKEEIIGNLTLEQVKSIAEKKTNIYGKTLADKVKQILGTCKSMGVTCEGKNPREIIAKINSKEISL